MGFVLAKERLGTFSWILLAIFVTGWFSPLGMSQAWLRMPYRLSTPGSFVRYQPYFAADRHGAIHLFWSQDTAQQCCTGNEQFSLVRYARFDGHSWSGPIDLIKVLNSRVDAASVCIDSSDTLHLAFVKGGELGVIYYTNVPLADSLKPERWKAPAQLAIPQPRTNQIRLRVGSDGAMHLLFTKAGGATKGIFYTRSVDRGGSWSSPLHLDPDIPDGFIPGTFQFEIDPWGALHLTWLYWDRDFTGRWLRYLRSVDGGKNWDDPVTLDQFDPATGDPLTQSVRSPHGIAFTGDSVHVIWTGGPKGGPTGVGRKHRISPDHGATWGEIALDVFGTWGEQNGDGVAADSNGSVHWVGLGRKFVSSGQLRQGLWSASWDANNWTDSAPLVTALYPGADTPRLASTPQGSLVTAFRGSSPLGLYATHTSQPSLYFPHFGDGNGLSMLFAFNNPLQTPVSGRLSVYDRNGNLQTLPFEEGGSRSEIELSIGPNSTRVLRTLGTSSPLKSGYIRAEFDEPGVSGVAIFKYETGPEASVLPAEVGRRFALFVEQSAALRTGIALAQLTPSQIVTLQLYGLDGTLQQTKDYSLSGAQEARFIDELFDVPSDFKGILTVESEALLSSVGLRFGNGVLSTIPVTDLDSEDAQGVFFFPHYGDGSGLSMQFVVNNFHQAGTADGELSVFGKDGSPQELPFGDFSASQVPITLPPYSTHLLTTDGSSVPLKLGYAKVELSQAAVAGVAIFRYASGLEASVLPARLGTRFALFVERSATLDTGIAVSRIGLEPVSLSLFDEDGTLVGAKSLEFEGGGVQQARFLGEIFTGLPAEFRGMLIVESTSEFAMIGLRFGGGVLSTIPVSAFE